MSGRADAQGYQTGGRRQASTQSCQLSSATIQQLTEESLHRCHAPRLFSSAFVIRTHFGGSIVADGGEPACRRTTSSDSFSTAKPLRFASVS